MSHRPVAQGACLLLLMMNLPVPQLLKLGWPMAGSTVAPFRLATPGARQRTALAPVALRSGQNQGGMYLGEDPFQHLPCIGTTTRTTQPTLSKPATMMLRATTVPVSVRTSRPCAAPRPGVSKCVSCAAPAPGPSLPSTRCTPSSVHPAMSATQLHLAVPLVPFTGSAVCRCVPSAATSVRACPSRLPPLTTSWPRAPAPATSGKS